jgi:hypothetical protein
MAALLCKCARAARGSFGVAGLGIHRRLFYNSRPTFPPHSTHNAKRPDLRTSQIGALFYCDYSFTFRPHLHR